MMNTDLEFEAIEIDLETPTKPKRKGRKKSEPERESLYPENNREPAEVTESETETAWLAEPQDEEIPESVLGASLEQYVDWIDMVDPVTGEVSRQPVLKGSGKPESVDIEPEPGAAETPDISLTDKIAVDAPPDPAPEAEGALSGIISYLLSPEGAELKRQAREAAHLARKAAYDEARLKTDGMIDKVRARLADLSAHQLMDAGLAKEQETFAAAEKACAAARREAQARKQAFAEAQRRFEQAADLNGKAKRLVEIGQMSQVLADKLEADHLEKLSEMLSEWGRCEADSLALQREEAALASILLTAAEVQQSAANSRTVLEQEVQAEIERLEAGVKELQETIAAQSPEVRLWQAVQAERQRLEDELAGKLIGELPSQGIRKVMQEAARQGLAQNGRLLAAVFERQERVARLIEYCREKAETLSAFPEALPVRAYALLVRGDSIRVVDAGGHELTALYPSSDASELHTVRSRSGRRWKIEPERDCYLVKT